VNRLGRDTGTPTRNRPLSGEFSVTEDTTLSDTVTLKLESTAFTDGLPIPADYTADGANISPPLRWDDPPNGTQSLALICDDPDAPRGTFTHWVLFNMPADTRDLPADIRPEFTLPGGARQGLNDFGRVGYDGPAPPPGPAHRYFFKLYALGGMLALPAGATKAQVLDAMHGRQLAEVRLVGVYGRERRK
jgi:Raf kinase inhibitor-like YbhB/YbcL family protein